MSVESLEASTVTGEESAAEQVEETVEVEDTDNDDTNDEGGDTEDAEDNDDAEDAQDLSDEDSDGDASEGDDEGKYKKNASERIRELVERSKSAEKELNNLKSKFEESQRKQEAAEKPYYELDMSRLESDLASMTEQVEDLKLEGKILEAVKIQRNIDTLLEAVDKNENSKAEWLAKQSERATAETKAQARVVELDDAARFYQKEMKIPTDVWDASGLWLKNEMEAKPLVGKKFSEIFDRQGAVAAIEWAHQYTLEHMGKGAKEAKSKKEDAKKILVGGQSNTAKNYSSLQTFDDLMKLSGPEIEQLEKANPKLFDTLIKSKLR